MAVLRARSVVMSDPDFQKVFPDLVIDNNKNISRKNTDTEREKILKTYGNKISETLLPFFHYVIVLGLQSRCQLALYRSRLYMHQRGVPIARQKVRLFDCLNFVALNLARVHQGGI